MTCSSSQRRGFGTCGGGEGEATGLEGLLKLADVVEVGERLAVAVPAGIERGGLHHVEGEEARLELLREVTRRLKPGAPLVLGCRVGKDPELTNVELRRWRAYGISSEELVAPRPLFVSLQFKVFLARFDPGTTG